MIRSDLKDLKHPCPSTHAGLWLERYLGDFEQGAKQVHIDTTVQTVQVPADYERFFRRHRAALETLDNVLLAKATVRGRMVVGLGAESVLETSITLHRTYGVPYIPGSALKGLAAAAAHRHLEDPGWQKATDQKLIGESHRILFGDQESSGYVVFHDALWFPGSRLPLDPDVITVHHGEYYLKGKAPTDWDNPVPVAFLSARGSYLVALTGPAAWTQAAFQILKGALDQDGVGAKTAAGYGRMDLEWLNAPPPPIAWQPEVTDIRINNAAQKVPPLLAKLRGEERRQAARAMYENLKGNLKGAERRSQPWVQELLEAMK